MGFNGTSMCLPMAPCFLLVWLSLASVALAAQDPAVGPAPKPLVSVTTEITPPASLPDASSIGNTTELISGSSGRQFYPERAMYPNDPKGKREPSVELVIAPTVQPDGTISISLRVVLSGKTNAVDPKAEKPARKRESKAYDVPLTFCSVLVKDGLFSIQDGKSDRRWYKLGATIEGWSLLSYNQEKQLLVLGQGAKRQELRLSKSVIEASDRELSTVVTLRSGETVKVNGLDGLAVEVTASLAVNVSR